MSRLVDLLDLESNREVLFSTIQMLNATDLLPAHFDFLCARTKSIDFSPECEALKIMPKGKEKSQVTVPTEYSHLESLKIPSNFIKYFPLTLVKKMVRLKRVALYGTSDLVHSEGGTFM